MSRSAFSRSVDKLSFAKALKKIHESSLSSADAIAASNVQSIALEESILLMLEQVLLMFGWEMIELSGLSSKVKKNQSLLSFGLIEMNDFLESQGYPNQVLVSLLSNQSNPSHWLFAFHEKLSKAKLPAKCLSMKPPDKIIGTMNLIPVNNQSGEYSVNDFVDLTGAMLDNMRSQLAEF